MPTAPTFCDVMRVLAADGKHGNMIVTWLAPDHAHDDGESLVALASTNKWLYQDEDVQAALGQVQMFHAIPGRIYRRLAAYELRKRTIATAVSLLRRSNRKQFKAAIRYLSHCGPHLTLVRDLLMLYRQLPRRYHRGDKPKRLVRKVLMDAEYMLLDALSYSALGPRRSEAAVQVKIARPSDGWLICKDVAETCWRAAATPIDLSGDGM
jgi:hypothetical protein